MRHCYIMYDFPVSALPNFPNKTYKWGVILYCRGVIFYCWRRREQYQISTHDTAWLDRPQALAEVRMLRPVGTTL